MIYIRNIFFGALIGLIFGYFIGTIFGYKVSNKSNWEEQQQTQQIAFSVFGAIGGIVLGVKLAEEENNDK